ncbi:DUF4178 domain-containing protein [Gracilibacillus sp. YIM 98692]|uniref:DUF4178 domain-containing protein n=1 Tax=Gracilibacillus sp. YIM 98692 TaxID=2663532 RepID=UPI0013D4E62F|nr:DUF4178 domain-containing protein [Gracilibacillus sp. YIM 98692]
MGFFSKFFSKKEETKEVKERTPLTIQVGDIIEYDLADYEVVGKITYRDSHYEWISYQLLGEGKNIWLSAEMDDELELGIYYKIQLPNTNPYPEKLTYQDKTYHMEEQGQADVTGEGRSGSLNGQRISYAEYTDKKESSFISLESWGTEVEASYGYPIQPFEIKIIAGS